MPFQDHFDLDIPRAIHGQLIRLFEELDTAPLTDATLDGPLGIVRSPGVYGLYVPAQNQSTLVYVGKTNDLGGRLDDHRVKLAGRQNINLHSVTFKCVSVHRNWNAYAPESILLNHYRPRSLCEWNGTGFGTHDPGRERETTDKRPEGFDQQYPIRDDIPCDWIGAGEWDVLDLLRTLKGRLPYLLRFQADNRYASQRGHQDYRDKTVFIPRAGMQPREILQLVIAQLPGWQATAFPSHLILYRENRAYPHGQIIARNQEDRH